MNDMSAARWIVSRSDIGLGLDASDVGAVDRSGLCRELCDERRKLPVDVTCNAPALIDERRIQVNASGAGPQHRNDSATAAAATVALDGDAPAREPCRPGDILQCAIEH